MNAPASTLSSRTRLAEQEREAYQRFLGAARAYWATRMFAGVQRQVESEIGAPDTLNDDFRSRVEALPTYQVFAWFERHLQRMRYSGHRGLAAGVEARRAELSNVLSRPLPEGLLTLNTELRLPSYFVDCDIHQQPGGVAAHDLSAFIYRDAVQSGGVVGVASLHDRHVQRVLERFRPTRILDMGCGFGRSTLAFAKALPEARVCGVDLSASCVRVAAHETPEAMWGRVNFLQADATRTGLPDCSVDLLTSTMLLHEMPEYAVRQLIAEAGRLVRPGGMVAHLDFLPPEEPLLRMIYEGHAARNNEPYLLEHSWINLQEAYAAAGFNSVEISDFAETDDALQLPPARWRLPWKLILAVKSEDA